MSLPRAASRLLLATTYATAEEKLGAMRASLATVRVACEVVMRSDPLKEILGLVVEVSYKYNLHT